MRPLLKLFKKEISIEDRLKAIKEGDAEERDKLISEYIPFIIKSITKVTNRYIEIENNDEYSIGLQAFNEAIDRYEFGKGTFISYAETVIRSRIIDYKRKGSNKKKIVSLNEDIDEGLQLIDTLKEDDFTKNLEMKEQIDKFKSILKDFDISLEELVKESPKHIDTRLNTLNIARKISKDVEIKEELYRKKTLPMKRITEKYDVTKKVLKGNRKFIIASVLIIDSDLDLIKSYIDGIEGRVKYGI